MLVSAPPADQAGQLGYELACVREGEPSAEVENMVIIIVLLVKLSTHASLVGRFRSNS